MKISYSDYVKKTDASVLVAEAIFSDLEKKYPCKKISEIAETTSGGTPLRSNPDYYDGNIPWLKSGELKDGFIESAEEYISEVGLKNSSAKLLPENTLLLAMYGATAGRTGITKIKAATNQAICAIFPKSDITQEYLYWFLRQYRYNFIDISKGGAQPNISQSVINATKVPTPDIKLQNQISNVLSTIEANGTIDISILPLEYHAKVQKVFASKNNVEVISSELTHQLSLVKKLRQQLLQDAVQGKLVPQNPNDEPASELLKKIKAEKATLRQAQGTTKKEKELPPIKAEEIPFDIPKGWVWCRLGEIAEIVRGGSPRPAGDPTFYGGNIPFLKVGDLTGYEDIYVRTHTHSIKEAGLHKTRFVEENTLMLTNSGATLGVPRICTFSTTFNDGIAAFLNLNQTDKIYLYFFLKSKSAWFLKEASRGQGQPNLNTDIIAFTLFPLPPLLEQHRIVQKLDELMQTCDALEASIKESAGQNEKLLQQVLREALQP